MADGNVPSLRPRRKRRSPKRPKGYVRPWTDAADARLREMWPDCTQRTICDALHRSWDGVRNRVRKLNQLGGIHAVPPRWKGYVSLNRALKATGYCYTQLARILAAYRRHMRSLPMMERVELPSAMPTVRGRSTSRACKGAVVKRTGIFRVIELQAALDAVEWWHTLETQAMAARRMGRAASFLSSLTRRARRPVKLLDRRAPAWWDDLVARYASGWRSIRKVTR